MDAVTTVLLERGREPKGLKKMLGISLALHVLAGVALVAAPFILGSSSAEDEVTPVMTITLPGAGTTGPMNGGSNPIAARPVQTTEPAKKPEAVRPPAERTPEMTMPAPKGKTAPKTPTSKAVEEGSGHTPTRGTEVRQGAAFGETGGVGSGFGLSTGGLGGGGMTLDVGNFCCPDYLMTLVQRIKENWNERGGAVGEVVVKFTIQRDGTLTNVGIERSSNVYALDAGAQRAVVRTAKLPPLPAAFDRNTLTVALTFRYQY